MWTSAPGIRGQPHRGGEGGLQLCRERDDGLVVCSPGHDCLHAHAAARGLRARCRLRGFGVDHVRALLGRADKESMD
eukprot:5168427-Prymnesium_polylepis.1